MSEHNDTRKPMFVISFDLFVRADEMGEAELAAVNLLKSKGLIHCVDHYYDPKHQENDEVRFEVMESRPFPMATCECGREYPSNKSVNLGCNQCEHSKAAYEVYYQHCIDTGFCG